MPRPFYLIDGYNLMHAAGMVPDGGAGKLQRSRARFLRFLAERLSAAERTRTTIVFDAAAAPPGWQRETSQDEMRILFSPAGREADDTIERLIAEHSAPRQIVLVSGDHRLQRAVRRRRGRFTDGEPFLQHLLRRETASKPAPLSPELAAKLGRRTSAAETRQWLEVFGELSELSDEEFADETADELRRWQARVDELFEEEGEK